MAKQWPPPGYPVLEGFQELTDDWALTLTEPMARRIEDENLVFWRPGFTVWIAAWGEGEEEQPRKRRLKGLKREMDPEGRVVRDKDDGDIAYFAYRVRDVGPEGHVESLCAFAVSDVGHLQLSIYFDDVVDEAKALALIDSVRFAGSDEGGEAV
jgi:hypothetical protein